MLAMFARRLELPSRSFFLFGPRGTGKTTWLGLKIPDGEWFDLLRTQRLLDLMRTPDLFRQRVESLKEGSWVVVDEIQRMPELLNEIHSLMNQYPGKYLFAITGSSARKLKRGGINLLAGRAVNRQFFPLTGYELDYGFEIDDLLRFGTLPVVAAETTPEGRIDLLEAYVANYVREEIQQEAAVKNLDSFARFLEIAGIMNAQVTNISGIARDAAVARPTVQGYFQVLIDTLIGVWLPAWQPRMKIKEVSHPKFYFFDPGVVRGVGRRLREPLGEDERGWLLETVVLHELRSWIEMANAGGQLFYWRTPSGAEVDFVWVRGSLTYGIEVKAARRWKPEFGRALREMHDAGLIARCFGVYGGSERLQDGPVCVLPIKEFMRDLAEGQILS
jgi:predicted AAA+ superfamily ATPase